MKATVHNPAGGPQPASNYAQGLGVSEASRWLVVSGQVGVTAEGTLLPDTESQMQRCFENIFLVLADAGMDASNIVKLTVFLVDAQDVPAYRGVRDEMMQGHTAASTLLVVNALAHPQWKVEIEAIAAA